MLTSKSNVQQSNNHSKKLGFDLQANFLVIRLKVYFNYLNTSKSRQLYTVSVFQATKIALLYDLSLLLKTPHVDHHPASVCKQSCE